MEENGKKITNLHTSFMKKLLFTKYMSRNISFISILPTFMIKVQHNRIELCVYKATTNNGFDPLTSHQIPRIQTKTE